MGIVANKSLRVEIEEFTFVFHEDGLVEIIVKDELVQIPRRMFDNLINDRRALILGV